MLNNRQVVDSSSGVAEATQIRQSSETIQVACINITTGTGTVTITVRAGGDSAYTAVTDGTIDLTTPTAVLIEGKVNSVKATSSSGADVFKLEIIS